ncbi:MAG: ATP12 family protein, partial [Pseudomonadota bacterium]
AEAAAAEWEAQAATVKPAEMPVTRAVNTALDRTIPEFDMVAEQIVAYGRADLLCYRAEGPAALIERQAAAWDPLLKEAEARFGARLSVTAGIVHAAQDEAAIGRLEAAVRAHDGFALTGLYDLVALSGSLVVGLLSASGALAPAEAWGISRLDEIWQAEQWGEDAEAERAASFKAREFAEAARFVALSRPNAADRG